MTEMPCPICGNALKNVCAVPWHIKMLELWSDGAVPFAIRKRGTDYAGTCDRCDKRLLIEARGPRYAEINSVPHTQA